METLHEKLIDTQQRLHVPKDQRNDFGGFMYRNLDAIEEKAKPLLAEHKLLLRFTDRTVVRGNRVFLRSTAILTDGKDTIKVSAEAQHAESKTKMDDAQLTGSCSSYARKYAVQGLFLIDDNKDPDTMSNAPSAHKTSQNADNDALSKAKQKVHLAFTDNEVNDAGEMRVILVDVLGKPTIDSVEDADKVIERLKK